MKATLIIDEKEFEVEKPKLIKDLGSIFINDKAKHKELCGIYECPICKKEFTTRHKTVKNGSTSKCRSCGSKGHEHGSKYTKLYNTWSAMKQRCNYKNHIYYANYGGRGITVCDEWSKSFVVFKKWALENGYKDGLSIDRIDNDKNYEPNNCQWLSLGDNARKAHEIFSKHDKIKHYDKRKQLKLTQTEYAKYINVSRSSIQRTEKIINSMNSKEIENLRLEALAMSLPEWKPNGNCSVYHNGKVWTFTIREATYSPEAVMMPEACARKICKILNVGRYSLEGEL